MKSSTYRAVAALLGIGFLAVFASGPSPRTVVGAGLASAGAQQAAPLHQPRQIRSLPSLCLHTRRAGRSLCTTRRAALPARPTLP